MPASPLTTASRPALWRLAIRAFAEGLQFASSIALLLLFVSIVRDQPIRPDTARVILPWAFAAGILAGVFTRRLSRPSPSSAQDTPAV